MQTFLWMLCGGLLPIPILFCGLFFAFKLKLQPFRSPQKMALALKKSSMAKGVSPFRATTLALAGTLGVGNIVGVANAIWLGGPGAIFWMWASALAAMLLKYAEILLAVKHNRKNPDGSRFGGAPFYIRDLLEERKHTNASKVLSFVFALLLIANAFFMGSAIQVNAISSAAKGICNFSPFLCGLFICLCLLPFMKKGVAAISAFTEYFVPIMSLGYVVLSLAVLLIKKESVLPAITSVFSSAFSFSSTKGGILGFFTSEVIRIGCMRGLLSNEGGAGTAPTAHACADTDSPAAQGIFGIFEVFIDTILLCTLTALVILVNSDSLIALGEDSIMITVKSFSNVLGGWSQYFLLVAVFAFGFATVVCWFGYGKEALRFLPSSKFKRLYPLLFLLSAFWGAILAPNFIFTLSDVVMTLLTLINLFILILGRKEISTETKNFLASFT